MFSNWSRLFHFSAQTLIGVGTIGFRDDGFVFSPDGSDHLFFVAEPGVNLIVNVTTFFRLGGGVGFRFVNGADFEEITDPGIRGFSSLLMLKFGKF